jgi:hypothetical protein
MLTNKYVRTFLENISTTSILLDLNAAKEYQKIITNARKQFEDDLTSALILLSDEQQARLLAQTLKNFKGLEYSFDLKNLFFEDKNNSQAYDIATSLYTEYLRFSASKSPNRQLELSSSKLLMRMIVSEEATFAKSMTYQNYASKISLEELAKWHLNNLEFAKTIKGALAPKGISTPKAVLAPSLNKDLNDSQNVEIDKSNYAIQSIPWKHGLNDFAELLYKLERTGVIDLKSFFENGGKGIDLARSFCLIFSFNSTTKNPVATLNTYISEIRKGLGNGAYDLGILKAIGRSRTGTMDDILPDHPDQNLT